MTRIPAILLALTLPVLAGCFPRPDYSDLPDPSVIGHSTTKAATITIADFTAPTAQERADVTAALAQLGDQGYRVHVRLPRGSAVPKETALRDRLRGLGIDPAMAIVDLTPQPVATLDFLRITVTAPNCAALVTPSEETSLIPRPDMSFGCATYTNLSQQVSDPADLVAPRNYGGADAATSAIAIDRYHDDKVKRPRRSTTTSDISQQSSGGENQ